MTSHKKQVDKLDFYGIKELSRWMPVKTFWSTSPTTVPAGNGHYFCTCCLPDRPHFFKISQKKTKSSETVITTGGTVDLAEWIIDAREKGIFFFFF